MHARPAARRRHRHVGVRPAHRRVGVPGRADLRQRRARRRGEPRVAPHAGRAARADGGAPGHGRRRDAPAARSRSSSSRRRTRSAAPGRFRCPRASSTASRSSPSLGLPGRAAEREILDGEGGVDALAAIDAGHDARRVVRRRSLAVRRRALRAARCSTTCSTSPTRRASHPDVVLGASPRAIARPAARGACARDGHAPRLRLARRREGGGAARHSVTASCCRAASIRSPAAASSPRSPERSRRRHRDGVVVRTVDDRSRRPDRTEAGRHRPSAVHGPGDLTLTAVVLFALGAYGVAAGGVTGRGAGGCGRHLRVHAVRDRDRLADRGARRVSTSRSRRRPTRPSATRSGCASRSAGGAARVEVRVLDPTGHWWRSIDPDRHGHRTPRDPARRVRPRARAGPHVGAARRLPADTSGAGRAAGADHGRAPAAPVAGARCTRSRHARETGRRTAIAGRRRRHRAVAVRPYVAGDPARLVHWPTSARRGDRSSCASTIRRRPTASRSSSTSTDRPTLVELAASTAAGIGRDVLARGGRLVLATRERRAPVCAEVARSRVDLGRRLAAAAPRGRCRTSARATGRCGPVRATDMRALTSPDRVDAAPVAPGSPWRPVAIACAHRARCDRRRRGAAARSAAVRRRGRRRAGRGARRPRAAVAPDPPGRGRDARPRRSRRAAARRLADHRQLAHRVLGARDARARSCSSTAPTPNGSRRSRERPAALRRVVSRSAARRRDHGRDRRRGRRSRSFRRVTDQLGRRMWPGSLPSLDRRPGRAELARKRHAALDMTTRPRLSDRVVFTVEATAARLLARRGVRHLGRAGRGPAVDDRRPVPLPACSATGGSCRSTRSSTTARGAGTEMRADVPHRDRFLGAPVRGAEPGRGATPTGRSSAAPTAPRRRSAASARARSTR